MSKTRSKNLPWVRFPQGEAKLRIISHPDMPPGLLIVHRDSDEGRAVMERARALGFQIARMKSGVNACVYYRNENGYPFGIRQLAEAIGGVVVKVSEEVIRGEAYPRPAATPTVSTAKDAEPAVQEPQAEPEPETYVADASAGEDIAAFLADLDLRPDTAASEKTVADAPEFA